MESTNKNKGNMEAENEINKHLQILETYIREGEKDINVTISGYMAIASLYFIKTYIKTSLLCKDFGIEPILNANKKHNKEEPEIQSRFLIEETCDEVKEMLLNKNRKYGDSALNPQRIFSKADTIEQINVRIDDKLSRIKSKQLDEDEDVESDLLGYLILKKVVKKKIQIKNYELVKKNDTTGLKGG